MNSEAENSLRSEIRACYRERLESWAKLRPLLKPSAAEATLEDQLSWHPSFQELVRLEQGRLHPLDREGVDYHLQYDCCKRCQSLLRVILSAQGLRRQLVSAGQGLLPASYECLRPAALEPALSLGFAEEDKDAPDHPEKQRLTFDEDGLLGGVFYRDDAGRKWLHLEHSALAPGSLVYVTLAGVQSEAVIHELFVMLRPGLREQGPVVGRLCISIAPIDDFVVLASDIRSSLIEHIDPHVLRSSFDDACQNDPCSIVYWKNWAKDVTEQSGQDDEGGRDSPTALPQALRGALEAICRYDPPAAARGFARAPAADGLVSSTSTIEEIIYSLEVLCGRQSDGVGDETDLYGIIESLFAAFGAGCFSGLLVLHRAEQVKLKEAADLVDSPEFASILKKYFETKQEYSDLDTDHIRIRDDLLALIEAELLTHATKQQHGEAVQHSLERLGRACRATDLPAEKLAEQVRAARMGQGAAILDRQFCKLDDQPGVGRVRDVIRVLRGESREPSRFLEIPILYVFTSGEDPSTEKETKGEVAWLRLELLKNGNGGWYPNVEEMRLVPMTSGFFSMADSIAAPLSSLLRERRLDVRWSISDIPKAKLPALHGSSVSGAMAIGLRCLLSGEKGRVDWSVTADVDSGGLLKDVAGVPAKVEAAIQREPERIKLLIVSPGNRDEALHVAKNQRRRDGLVADPTTTVDDACKLIRRRIRGRRLKVASASIAACLLLGVTTWVFAANQDPDHAALAPGSSSSARPPGSEGTIPRSVGGPATGDPVDRAGEGRQTSTTANGSLALSTGPVLFDVRACSSSNDLERMGLGKRFGVFYNTNKTPKNEYAMCWLETVTTASNSQGFLNVYYHIGEPESYAGWWHKVQADWSKYLDGELVLRFRQMGRLDKVHVFDEDGKRLMDTDTADLVKVEVILSKNGPDGNPIKEEIDVEITKDMKHKQDEDGCVEFRYPFAKMSLISGLLKAGMLVEEVTVVFEERKICNLPGNCLQSNLGIQMVAVTDVLGGQIPDTHRQ